MQDHIAAANPLGAILPNHATKRVLDEDGRPISKDKLFTQVEQVEKQGSREIGATTETKTLAWWGIRDDNTPAEAWNTQDTVDDTKNEVDNTDQGNETNERHSSSRRKRDSHHSAERHDRHR